MSKLDAITERVGGKRNNLPAAENFALLVSGYGKDPQGRDAVMGTRLDTGDEVTVVLRPYKGTATLRAPRAEVKDFKAEEGEISKIIAAVPAEMRTQILKGIKAKTEPGGTIIVQRGFVEKENAGVISAGWLQSAAKYSSHAKVIADVMLRVDPPVYFQRANREQSFVTATALSPKDSHLVKSEDDLKSALLASFAGLPIVKGRPMVLVRISEGSTAKALEFDLPAKKNPNFESMEKTPNESAYLFATPKQATKLFLESAEGKVVAQFAGDPDLKVEVIPGAKVNLGSQAKASLEARANGGLAQINSGYRFVKAEVDETGFTPSYLVAHEGKENDVFSAAEPLSNRPALFHPRDVPTAHFAGKPTVVRENKEAAQQAAPADEAGAGDQTVLDDEDDDFSLTDVVAGALPAEATPRASNRPRP